jgi:hypothetical protein
LKTDASCVATWQGMPLVVTGKGTVKAASLVNVEIK